MFSLLKLFRKDQPSISLRYLKLPYDSNELLVHSMFEVFSRFMEKKHPKNYKLKAIETDKIDGKLVQEELRYLYHWWNSTYNKVYPQAFKMLQDSLKKSKPIKVHQGTLTIEDRKSVIKINATIAQLKRKQGLELDEMLARLIKVRKYL